MPSKKTIMKARKEMKALKTKVSARTAMKVLKVAKAKRQAKAMSSHFEEFDDLSKYFMSGKHGGQYAGQSFVMYSTVGPDGKTHHEKFASSEAGSAKHKILEKHQAYSNSSTASQR